VSYLKQVAKGVSWMGLLRGLTRGIAFLRLIVLARLLDPAQFGIYGVASLVLALLEVFTETGVNAVLIQSKEKISEYLDTAWVVSIVRGALISALMLVLAWPVSVFFKNPASLGIIIFLSLVPFLRGFINPMIVNFQKELDFKKEFLFQSSFFSWTLLVAIITAFLTKSAYSLAFGLTAGVLLEIFLSFFWVKPTPKLTFKKEKVKFILKRGKWLTFSGIFNYLFHQGDDIIVGRLMDAASLGTYQVAYKISTLPVYETGEVFNKVTFPVFSKMTGDKKNLKSAFLKIKLDYCSFGGAVRPFAFLFRQASGDYLFGRKLASGCPCG